ncbi:MAG: hypothetical protein K6B44_04025 [Lachnospiraceae bacterium]|nr:hypothetical protein [Lachnospiraceae bacterium]
MRYLIFTGCDKNPLFDILFNDLKGRDDVILEPRLPVLPKDPLYRFVHARTFNKTGPAPFRGLWNKLSATLEETVAKEAESDSPLWLVFNNFSVSFFEPGVLKKWKKKYNAKLCLYFLDRADSYYAAEAKLYTGCVDFDLILTYHRPDEKQYGFKYFDCYYSALDIKPAEKQSDIFFWGSDGDRRGIVESIYRRVTGFGLSADFGICYPLGEGRQEGITYDLELHYEQILERTLASKVILDVVRPDSCGVSLRYFEAVVYGKKLITNNPLVREMRYFDPARMLVIEKPEDISREFMETPVSAQKYEGDFSPENIMALLE